MKRLLSFSVFVVLASAALLGFASGRKTIAPASGVALVELFTSEGCSSCPPADELLAETAKHYTDNNVFVLSYHVDYWDRLGWKDPFSNAAWTARQNRYAQQFKLESIYTPEAVVNGRTEFTGSDKNRLSKAIFTEIKTPYTMRLELEAHDNGKNNITVLYQLTGATGPSLNINIALVQRSADTEVKRGENEGKRLHHINIVRDLKTVAAASGSTVIQLPAGLKAAEAQFLERRQQFEWKRVVGPILVDDRLDLGLHIGPHLMDERSLLRGEKVDQLIEIAIGYRHRFWCSGLVCCGCGGHLGLLLAAA